MKQHVTFRIDKSTLKKALAFAEEENRSISNFIETAVIAAVLAKELSKSKPKNHVH